jgi:prepilin-type processing-associated H-X9-DG protein
MVELLVVVAVLSLLAAMLLPAFVPQRRPPTRMNCLNNLKQVGLAFRIFAAGHQGKFPPMLGTNEGGVKEWVNTAPGGAGDPAQTFRVFVAMSNELATPKAVVCAADKNRVAITNFHGMAYATPLAQGGQNASLSYFVNLGADETQPQAILAGDRNLSTGTNARRATDYDAFFRVEQRIRPADVKPGGAYANLEFHDTIHRRQGNVALADGSVQPVPSAKFRAQILASTNVHRLIFPFVPGKNE